MISNKLYYIQGNHPESNDEWIEGEDPLPAKEIMQLYYSLEIVDTEFYSIFEYGTNREVFDIQQEFSDTFKLPF